MQQGNIDRRSQKTKQSIQAALIKLLEEKSFPKISVTDICREADINRNTFYSYYKRQSDVCGEILKLYFNRFSAAVKSISPSDIYAMTLAILDATKTGSDARKVISHCAEYHGISNAFDMKYRDAFIASQKEAGAKNSDEDLARIHDFIVRGYRGVLISYVKQDTNKDDEAIAHELAYMCNTVLQAMIKKD